MNKTYDSSKWKKSNEPVHGCLNKKDVCAGLGVDPKHWNGYNHLCCNTDKKCRYRRLIEK